jgi:ABC-type sugar transport system ATPase subunit
MNKFRIDMQEISKSFEGQLVINTANFSIQSGEVCSILGENGAGKTTLMKILAGVYAMDRGAILVNGEKVNIDSVIDSQKLGIRMIFQEPQLIDFFTAEENIFIGNEERYKNVPFINKRQQTQKAKEIFEYLQFNIDVNTPVEELSFSQKKMVEIAKALMFNVKVLVLDEVTASFTDPEIQNLFRIIRKLKQAGVAIVFISHRIEDAVVISDRIAIMRDGRIVDDNAKESEISKIIEKMAGEDYVNRYPKTRARKGKTILELRNVSNEMGTVKNANLYLRRGEIVGVAGLQGAGKSSLIKLMAGVEPVSGGQIYLNGEPVTFKNPHHAIKEGLVFLSEDYNLNLNLYMNTPFNITLGNLDRVKNFLLISSKKVKEATGFFIRHLNIKVMNPKQPIRYLSRGTQQKVALSKWLYANANIFIMDEPSMNLDIGSKVELYNIMNQLSHKGKALVVASSDLRELIGMCDRIYVMFSGVIVAELNADEANSIRILEYASGERKKTL